MRISTLVLAILAVRPALAQIDPDVAFPLAPGNRWEFRSAGDPDLRWEVVGEQVVAGQRIALLRFNGEATCGVRADVSGSAVYYHLVSPTNANAPCDVDEASARFPRVVDGADYFYIVGPPAGTPTFWVSGELVTGPTWFGSNRAGSYAYAWSVMEGLGPMAFTRTYDGDGALQEPIFVYILTYARVGGRSVGQSTVAQEAAEPATSALTLTADPNPARSHATIRYALPSAGPVRILLHDPLGRILREVDIESAPAGPGTVEMNVAGLSSGAYVVRVTSGTAWASTRLIVAR